LGDGDAKALRWFSENCTTFAKEFGLVPSTFAGLGLDGEQRRLFLSKLDEIYAMTQRMAMEQAKKEHA
jgi:hypothetical protein